ncbi:MAG: c-type cytochrome biogenesis protein CcmI [Halofilum sp. (in: g-proteobacteria)]
MIAFWLIAAAMLLVALAVILPPLFQRGGPARADASDETAATVAVYRERLADLEREYERGHITEADFAAAQDEAKRELLQHVPEEQAPSARTGTPRWMGGLTILVLPAITLAIYSVSGRPDLLNADRTDRLNPEQVSRYAQMPHQERISRLEAYLEARPNAPRGWALLASAYRAEERYRAAAEAYSHAVRTGQTTDARLIARQAEALLLANDRRFNSEVEQLIATSLQADPRNPLGLMLAGHAALTRGDDAEAVHHWQRLTEQIPEDDRRRQLVEALIARAEGGGASAAAQPDATRPASEAEGGRVVSVRVGLGESLRSQVEDDATVYVFAHPAGAEDGPPLAVRRTRAAALPVEVELSDDQAMMPSRTISSVERVVVTARISRSGDVTPSSGDLQGRSDSVATDRSDPIELTIDQRLD